MTVASLAVGDILQRTEVAGGDFGSDHTLSLLVQTLECRVDTFSTATSSQNQQSENVRTHRSYHASDPNLKTGDIVFWVMTGARDVSPLSLSPAPALEVQGTGHEGRPGSVPKLWWVEYREDTAWDYGKLQDA